MAEEMQASGQEAPLEEAATPGSQDVTGAVPAGEEFKSQDERATPPEIDAERLSIEERVTIAIQGVLAKARERLDQATPV